MAISRMSREVNLVLLTSAASATGRADSDQIKDADSRDLPCIPLRETQHSALLVALRADTCDTPDQVQQGRFFEHSFLKLDILHLFHERKLIRDFLQSRE